MSRMLVPLLLISGLLVGAWILGSESAHRGVTLPRTNTSEAHPAPRAEVDVTFDLAGDAQGEEVRNVVPRDGDAVSTPSDVAASEADALEVEGGVRVRVVDPNGRPLKGVRVLLRGEIEGAKNSDKTYAEGTTDAEGWTLLVEDAESLERRGRMLSMLGAVFSFEVRADVLFDPAPHQALGETPTSDTPVLLTVPASGSVNVRVLPPDEGPLPEWCQVFVFWRPLGSDEDFGRLGTPRANAVDGVAAFPVLPLGQEFRFGASGGKRYRYGEVIAPGPAHPGEALEVELTLGPPLAALTGRLVGEDGSPLTDVSVSMALFEVPADAPLDAEPDRVPWLWVPLDDQGRFRKATAIEANVDGRLVLMIHEVARHTESEVDRFARWDGQLALTPGGEFDLGDLVLTTHLERRFLVAGQVLAGDGSALRNVRVDASFWDSDARRWVSLAEERIQVARDGTFEVHTIEAELPERFTVSAGARGFSGASIEASPGDRGIQLVLPRAGGLSGRFVADDPRALPLLAVELSADGFSRNPDCALGAFHVDGLAPGTYSIHAKAHGTDWFFGGIEDVEVRAGGFSTDPRLASIDLGRSCRVLKLRVETSDGRPIPEHYIDIDDRERNGGNFRTDEDGELFALVPETADVLGVSVTFEGKRLGALWHAANGYETTLALEVR